MGWRRKVLLGVVILVGVLCFEGMRVLGGGRLFAPVLPSWVMVGYTGLYLLMMVFFVLLLVAQLVKVVMMAIPRWRRCGAERRRTCMNVLHGALLVLAGVICGVGMCGALRMPDVHELRLEVNGLRSPVRLALLTDLHADSVKDADFFRRLVQRTNELGADVIVIAGDFVDGTVAQRGANLEPLRGLRAPLGVYGVPGNHDYFSGYEEWLPALRGLGICMLNNEHVVFGAQGLVLAGVTDPASRLFGAEEPDVHKALAGAAQELPVVLVAHQPKLAAAAAEVADVQLSGHTHGGQLPGIAQLTAMFNNGWCSGLYRVSKRLQLYVSNGTSLWSGMPLRLGVPAEITLITLCPPAPQP